MDCVYDGKTSKETGTHYMDFDWKEFVEKLFMQQPRDPFTFSMEFLDTISERKLSELLGYMLITGAKNKYNKEIAQLLPQEIDELQKYYHSIGYEVKYQINTKMQYVSELNKELPVNFFQIDFQPYPMIYNNYNRPEKLI
jgi:hypothetical protein